MQNLLLHYYEKILLPKSATFRGDYLSTANLRGIHHLPPWRQLNRIAPTLTIFNGQEPYIANLQRKGPIPTSAPIWPAFQYLTPPRPAISSASSKIVPQVIEPKLQPSHDPTDWTGRSSKMLSRFCVDLSNLKIVNLANPGSREKVLVAIQQNRLRASLLAPEGSALHLAIDWVAHKISHSKHLKVSSVRTYLQRIFTTGLLRDKGSYELSLMDELWHERIFEESLNRANLDDSRKQDILITWIEVYQFAFSSGYVTQLALFSVEDVAQSITRPFLLHPSDFDRFFMAFWTHGPREHQVIALASSLAFYGGLRSGEVTGLTMKDIEVNGNEVTVYIRSGKTDSARRKIHFGYLAPTEISEKLAQYVNIRQQELQESGKNNLARAILFGPPKVPNGYKPSDMMDETRAALKSHFGEAVVFHSLRHCFVSWCFLRFYALHHHSVLFRVPGADHEHFSDSALNRFCILFSRNPSGTLDGSEADGLIILSKIVGHLTPSTMFKYYVHTFGYIQNHAMSRMDLIYGETQLRGDIIGQLIPNERSRSTQAKLGKDRRINALLPLCWEDL